MGKGARHDRGKGGMDRTFVGIEKQKETGGLKRGKPFMCKSTCQTFPSWYMKGKRDRV